MEKWLKNNLKYVTIVLLILFMFKNIQSCNRKMTIRIQEKNLSGQCDTLLKAKDNIINQKIIIIDSLNKELLSKEFLIKDMSAELRIAGVKYDEAQKRADAIQKTASSIKSNTTIQVNGVERDTIKNKK